MKTCKILLPLKGEFVQNVLQIKVSLFTCKAAGFVQIFLESFFFFFPPAGQNMTGPTNQLPLRGKRQELQQKSKANMNNGNEMQI